MEINLRTVKFSASEKLAALVEKKVGRLEKFFEGGFQKAEVTLEESKDGKKAKIQIHVPGEELIIDRTAETFEAALTQCVDAMKEKITRVKEKNFQK